jgi:hypothetical protein
LMDSNQPNSIDNPLLSETLTLSTNQGKPKPLFAIPDHLVNSNRKKKALRGNLSSDSLIDPFLKNGLVVHDRQEVSKMINVNDTSRVDISEPKVEERQNVG